MEIIKGAFLYGASGHAKVVADILVDQNIQVLGVVDDNQQVKVFKGFEVRHSAHGLSPIVICIGDNMVRKKIAEQMPTVTYPKVIHSSAVLSPSASIDAGTVILPGVIINADVFIGKHCIINTGASIDHESTIENYVHISPNATLCGNVYVGEGTWIGANATVIQGIKIGKWSIVGAGAVVIENVPDNVVVVGNPARIIKYR